MACSLLVIFADHKQHSLLTPNSWCSRSYLSSALYLPPVDTHTKEVGDILSSDIPVAKKKWEMVAPSKTLKTVVTWQWPKLIMWPSLIPIKSEVLHKMSHWERSSRKGQDTYIFTGLWLILAGLPTCNIDNICMWAGKAPRMGMGNRILSDWATKCHWDHWNWAFHPKEQAVYYSIT